MQRSDGNADSNGSPPADRNRSSKPVFIPSLIWGVRMSICRRFSLRSLLLVLSIVTFAVFWICWPAITARAFISAPNVHSWSIIQDEDEANIHFERIQAFVETPERSLMPPVSTLMAQRRTLHEVLMGEQVFDYGPYVIIARRGRIGFHGPFDKTYMVENELRKVVGGKWHLQLAKP